MKSPDTVLLDLLNHPGKRSIITEKKRPKVQQVFGDYLVFLFKKDYLVLI